MPLWCGNQLAKPLCLPTFPCLVLAIALESGWRFLYTEFSTEHKPKVLFQTEVHLNNRVLNKTYSMHLDRLALLKLLLSELIK